MKNQKIHLILIKNYVKICLIIFNSFNNFIISLLIIKYIYSYYKNNLKIKKL